MSESQHFGRFQLEPLRPGFIPSRWQPEPHVLWIGCSDSNDDESAVLNLEPGEIFVLRNLGNMVTGDLSCTTTVQYATQSLGVKHIFVCGHYGCGVVNGAGKDRLQEPWSSMLQSLRIKNRSELDNLPLDERERYMILLNIMEQVGALRRDLAAGSDLAIHGILYDRNGNRAFRVLERE